MVFISKVYTKSGDAGDSSLVGGTKQRKSSLRFSVVGDVDELNCQVGVVRTLAEENELFSGLAEELKKIQNRLFDIGSELATVDESFFKHFVLVDETDVKYLEDLIDEHNADLGDLKSFTIPGGSMLNAHLHIARSVSRRLERQAVALMDEENVNQQIMIYLNRLSDYFFVWSRKSAQLLKHSEYLWERKNGKN